MIESAQVDKRCVCAIVVSALLSACAGAPTACHMLDQKPEWVRLAATPPFVDDAVLEKMYYSGIPPARNDLVWYSDLNMQVAACRPGNRYGCGDYVVFYENVDGAFERKELDEFVVCSG